ncbi:MAG: ABC transporter substrate-binding protein [Dysgonamonadaceae bacterium]|jgi:NitT/TauT family transport system substrate-binding protein|nr:ABC transporter substrate-binding protein [Dysgonamonadaceae bacterium]
MQRVFYYLLFFGLAFSACKSPDKKTNSLKIGVMSSMDYVPLAVAREQGFFDRQGVRVEIQKFYSANDRDAAFQSGNIDGTVIDYTGAILQKAGGVDLKLTSACNATFCLMTAQPEIRQLSDLSNKKTGVSRNTVIDFCLEMALLSAHIPVTAIEKQEINKIPIRFEMMMKGLSDATVLPDPFISIATAKGAKSLVCMEDLGYAVTGIMFHTQAIDRKSDEIKAFYRDYNEAIEYIHTHSVEDLETVLVEEIGFPKALIASVQLPDYTPAQMPQEKDIQAVCAWLKEKKLIPEHFSTQDLSDKRFIQP